ncbi:MAG: hypothetical protein Q4F18_12335 [Clostridia bacterium]|nr:hypothetical protein [Clostridia bacterium]
MKAEIGPTLCDLSNKKMEIIEAKVRLGRIHLLVSISPSMSEPIGKTGRGAGVRSA